MKRLGKYFISAINFLLLLLWTYTATSKLINYQRFETTLKSSPVLQVQAWAPLLAWLVPIMEIIAAVCLLSERYRLKGYYFSLVLLLMFEIYIILALSSGQHLPCSCGGVIGKMTWKAHVIFNASFILITSTGIFLYKDYSCLENNIQVPI